MIQSSSATPLILDPIHTRPAAISPSHHPSPAAPAIPKFASPPTKLLSYHLMTRNTWDIIEPKLCDRYHLRCLFVHGDRAKICIAVDNDGGRYTVKVTNAKEKETTRGTFKAEVEVLTALAGGHLPFGHHTNVRTPNGFPNIYFVGTNREKQNIIVMDLMETYLYDFNYLESFSIRDHQNLACDMLDCLMVLHQHGFVHRKVKPQHFMINNRGKVQLIDFSLSTRYRDPNTNRHHPMRREEFFYGSIKYGSINALRMTCQSRRDDLESLGYSLIEMMKGSLPWDEDSSDEDDDDEDDEDDEDKEDEEEKKEAEIQRVTSMKISSSPWSLCAGLPKGLFDYMMRVRSMPYDQTPDYDALREMLRRK